MAGHVDLMRRRYEEFSAGDVEGATQNWGEDFVWSASAATGLPGSGEHRGKDQALAVLGQAVAAWDGFELTAEEFFEDGDTVVVLGRTDVRKGERSAQIPVVHVWRWQGEEIKRLDVHTDTLLTAQLLGLA